MKSSSKAMFGAVFLALVPFVGFAQVVENHAVLLSSPDVVLGDYDLGGIANDCFCQRSRVWGFLGGATVVGRGIIAGNAITVAVPEPSSAIQIGLLGASYLIRRRR